MKKPRHQKANEATLRWVTAGNHGQSKGYRDPLGEAELWAQSYAHLAGARETTGATQRQELGLQRKSQLSDRNWSHKNETAASWDLNYRKENTLPHPHSYPSVFLPSMSPFVQLFPQKPKGK